MKALPLVLLGVVACAHSEPRPEAPAVEQKAAPLAFIEDDYPRALAEARARGVPVFADVWVQW